MLNYAVHNSLVGYNQGMSDLLAPVLAVIQDEVDAFWCFAGLMEASVFVTSPKDDIMDRQLVRKNKVFHWLSLVQQLKGHLSLTDLDDVRLSHKQFKHVTKSSPFLRILSLEQILLC